MRRDINMLSRQTEPESGSVVKRQTLKDRHWTCPESCVYCHHASLSHPVCSNGISLSWMCP